MKDDTPKLLTIAQAAEYLNDTPRHVQQMYWDRRLTAVRLGRKVRFRREDLDKFILSGLVEARRGRVV